jgi:signal transduction histidine kinase
MRRVPAQLLLASLVLAAIVALVAGLSTSALTDAGRLAARLGEQQIEHLERADRLEDLLFEKGFVSSYLATRNRAYLVELEARKVRSRAWLDTIEHEAASEGERRLAADLRSAYLRYDEARNRTVEASEAGREAEAFRLLEETQPRVAEVLSVAHVLAAASRRELLDTLAGNDVALARARERILWVAAFAALAGLALGIWNGRRIARPIYELILQVESADPERVRLAPVDEGGNEFERLSAHVSALVGRLAEQRRRLLQAEKMQAVGEIAARLAHEVLNPVAAVKAAIQAEVHSGALPPASRATLVEADRTLSRIDGIISRLVRFSRPLEPRRRASEVAGIVDAGIRAAGPALARAGVRCEAEVPPLPACDVDPDLVAQVVTNLVVNAAQASPPGSAVSVRAGALPQQLVLEVVDRGHGLPEDRDRLFRPYFTTREKGHGLGLAICRNIVAEHGGTIEAHGGPEGAGARFVVTLPQPEAAWARPS